MAEFEQALKRLIEDPGFSKEVTKDPSRLTKDFKGLEVKDMLLLMQVWHASGDPEAMNILTLCHCCTSHLSTRGSPSQ
jgi:hypothetical protein